MWFQLSIIDKNKKKDKKIVHPKKQDLVYVTCLKFVTLRPWHGKIEDTAKLKHDDHASSDELQKVLFWAYFSL